MKSNAQSGRSLLTIIVILAALALLAGLISTFTGNDTQTAEVTRDSASATQDETPLETFANNIAEDVASPVTEAAEAKNEAMEAELEADIEASPAATSEPAVVTAPVVTEPEPSPTPATTPGTFSDYDASKLALAADGDVVLFFHAAWCPSCRGLESDINSKLGQIPANTHILKLDYDSETELKKKYGVVRQHTLVVVDVNGNEIKKLTGLTNTLSQVVGQL